MIAEATHRGLIHNGVTRYEPSLGDWYEPGGDVSAKPPELLQKLADICPPTAILSVPAEFGTALGTRRTHWIAEHAGILAWMRELAAGKPAHFRQWLAAARDFYPASKVGWNLSTSEDDVRFLPEVSDDALIATFMESIQGRQLLLATFHDVANQLGAGLVQGAA